VHLDLRQPQRAGDPVAREILEFHGTEIKR
jgi:hypothetical protein